MGAKIFSVNFKGRTRDMYRKAGLCRVTFGVTRDKQCEMSGERWTFGLTSSSGTGSLSRIRGYDGGGAGISDSGVPHCSRPSALPAETVQTHITATKMV